jgi:rhamnosyltransferase subunit B
MRFLLFPFGSHGDVHPFVGLGRKLTERGHAVTLYVNGHFEGLVRAAGLGYVEIGPAEEYRKALANPDLWHPRRGFKAVAGHPLMATAIRDQYRHAVEGTANGDAVVVGATMSFGVRVARETHRFPLATVHLQPAVLRSVIEPPTLPGVTPFRSRLGWRFLWWLADTVFLDPVLRPSLGAFRRELGLPRTGRYLGDWMHSPELILGLFPRWYADAPDWPARLECVGFPLYDEADVTPLPPGLEEFLAAGDAPVVFTPGSGMVQGGDFFAAATDACARLGRRGVLLTRFAEQVPASLPASVRHFAYAPFSRLLPRAAALVHHGGIGTTAQALRAGVPQLVMPLSHDQPDNATRVARLGVGRSLTPARFHGPAAAAALGELLAAPAVTAACRTVAERFAGSDALAAACDRLEALGRG